MAAASLTASRRRSKDRTGAARYAIRSTCTRVSGLAASCRSAAIRWTGGSAQASCPSTILDTRERSRWSMALVSPCSLLASSGAPAVIGLMELVDALEAGAGAAVVTGLGAGVGLVGELVMTWGPVPLMATVIVSVPLWAPHPA